MFKANMLHFKITKDQDDRENLYGVYSNGTGIATKLLAAATEQGEGWMSFTLCKIVTNDLLTDDLIVL